MFIPLVRQLFAKIKYQAAMVTTRLASPIAAIAAQLSYLYSMLGISIFLFSGNYISLYGTLSPNTDLLSCIGKKATKDLTYLKGMIRSPTMQKMEIPGLVTGIVLIIATIVLVVFTIKL